MYIWPGVLDNTARAKKPRTKRFYEFFSVRRKDFCHRGVWKHGDCPRRYDFYFFFTRSSKAILADHHLHIADPGPAELYEPEYQPDADSRVEYVSAASSRIEYQPSLASSSRIEYQPPLASSSRIEYQPSSHPIQASSARIEYQPSSRALGTYVPERPAILQGLAPYVPHRPPAERGPPRAWTSRVIFIPDVDLDAPDEPLNVSTYVAPKDFPEPCAVCMEAIRATERVSTSGQCMHSFHAHCMCEWVERQRTCPTCRSSL